MKLFIIISLLFLFSCNKHEDSKNNNILDVNAELSVNLKNQSGFRSSTSRDTTLLRQVIKNASGITGMDHSYILGKDVGRGIQDAFKDTVNLKIKFWGIDVITPEGSNADGETRAAGLSWLSSLLVNVVFTSNFVGDTIAYIPNSIIKSIHKRIKIAFDKGDYAECYRIFDTEYVAYPITGKQYRKLVADGIEKPFITGMIPESWYNEVYEPFPKNSEPWKRCGVNDEVIQAWHYYWFGEYYTDNAGNYPEWIQNK